MAVDRFVADPRSGGRLLVPTELLEAVRKSALDERAIVKRQFFADMGVLKKNTGEDEALGIDSPMMGQNMLWSSLHGIDRIGGYRKPSDTVPFTMLRQVARQSIIDRMVIATRVAQMKHFARFVEFAGDKRPGFRVVHRRHGDPTFLETPDITARCLDVQARLANVTPEIHSSIRDFFAIGAEEELVVDRKTLVIARDIDGRPARMHLIDGSTVKPRLEILLPWLYENNIDNQDLAAEIMSYDARLNPLKIDLTKAAYVQEVEGRFVAAWTADQMSIDTTNPSVRINQFGYGTSLLEQSLEATRAFMFAWNLNVEQFKVGIPFGVLAVYGDYDPEGLQAFKRQMSSEAGPGNDWRMPIIPGGPKDSFAVEYQKVRETPKDALFTEWIRMLIATKTAVFRMAPEEINFSADQGAGESIFGQDSTENEVSHAEEQGLHTMLMNTADWLTRAFVQQNFDDLILIVDGLDRTSESQMVTDMVAATQSFMTVDEARGKMGLPPLPEGLGGYINSPIFAQQQQMIQQAEMAAEQEEAYDEGDFGQPDEEGNEGMEQDSGEPQDGEDAPGGQWASAGPTKKPPMAATKKDGDDRKVGQRHPEGNPHDKKNYSNKKAEGKASDHHARTEEGGKGKPAPHEANKGKDDEKDKAAPKKGDDKKSPPKKGEKAPPKGEESDPKGGADDDDIAAIIELLKKDPRALKAVEAALSGDDDDEEKK